MRAWIIASNSYNFWNTGIASFLSVRDNLNITNDALHINPHSHFFKKTIHFSDIETVGTYHGFVLIKLNAERIRLLGINYDRLLITTWDNRKFIQRLPFEDGFKGKVPVWPARLMFITFTVSAPLIAIALVMNINNIKLN
jgi:hypothetical protein